MQNFSQVIESKGKSMAGMVLALQFSLVSYLA
jgi:hypothetical protein